MATEKELNDSIDVILNHMNVMSPNNNFSDILFNNVSKDHRTIQQSFIRELNNFLIKYKDAKFDLRNEASVKYAEKINNLDHYFPLI